MESEAATNTDHEHPCGHKCECRELGAQLCDRCEIAEVVIRRHQINHMTRGQALGRLYLAMSMHVQDLADAQAPAEPEPEPAGDPLERFHVERRNGRTWMVRDRKQDNEVIEVCLSADKASQVVSRLRRRAARATG